VPTIDASAIDRSDAENRFGFHEAMTGPAAARIWDGFANARVMVALSVLLLQGALQALGQPPQAVFLGLCLGYLAATVAVRLLPRRPTSSAVLEGFWWPTIGADIIAFSAMQILQPGGMNYTPLLALPVLMTAVLGTRTAALGTAAGVTLLLLTDAMRTWVTMPEVAASQLVQAGLTGTGYFVVAILVQPIAARLAREEERGRISQRAAAVQAQVNELVIAALTDGLLVVDSAGEVHAANPAARAMLEAHYPQTPARFSLRHRSVWHPLAELARLTFAEGGLQVGDITLRHDDAGPSRLQVRTRLTPLDRRLDTSLCVMFLQDLRENEARLRTEKMAAMGRMSAAVAHEIRNPLAAIVQANQLLDEELSDPTQKKLSLMVRQNAQRLVRIAEEVLDVSRAQQQFVFEPSPSIPLDESVGAVCLDWHVHAGRGCGLQLIPGAIGVQVDFDAEHLRRILVNLLENALRYISTHHDALQVRTGTAPDGQSWLEVWSDGPPLEPSVEQRLFEPFFSSESRSSGLGLYICRELCERHGAVMVYRRGPRPTERGVLAGNAFTVAFRRMELSDDEDLDPFATINS
jgi:two-component system sensor histidine kinase PilS (NtrC family)